jgi:hypothetical protein
LFCGAWPVKHFRYASAEQRLVPIGDHRLSINCDGKPGNSATVVLMAGGGRTAEDWVYIKPTVASLTYILVAHSIAGIYARAFETRFHDELAGLVFVDSSHEEQVMRQRENAPPGRTQ